MVKVMLSRNLLMQPVLNALNHLGGSGSVREIYDEVVKLENFDDEILAVRINPEGNNQSKIKFHLGWLAPT